LLRFYTERGRFPRGRGDHQLMPIGRWRRVRRGRPGTALHQGQRLTTCGVAEASGWQTRAPSRVWGMTRVAPVARMD